MEGWIKLHRKFLDWEWFDDRKTSHLFLVCLLHANHDGNRWRGVDIPRGSFVSSYPKLAELAGLTIQELRTSLSKLKSTGDLTVKSTSKYSMFSITNYDLYQGEQQAKQQTSNRRATTNNNDKNDKKDIVHAEFDEDFDKFWQEYPLKVNKKRSKQLFHKAIRSGTSFEKIMEGLKAYKTNKEDWRKWMHPTTWLNGEHWQDEYETQEEDNEFWYPGAAT